MEKSKTRDFDFGAILILFKGTGKVCELYSHYRGFLICICAKKQKIKVAEFLEKRFATL